MSETPPSVPFDEIKRRIKDPALRVVSFDVFDTLICRRVLEPWHVFLLIEKRLMQAPYLGRFDALARGFAKKRQSAERVVRKDCDAQHGVHREIRIEDVYARLAALHGLAPEDVSTLIALEQEVEFAQLIARRPVVALFDLAKSLGKEILIISDFIHPQDFVEQALARAGIHGWDQCFVSSAIGVKKIQGEMFEELIATRGYDPKSWLHIGDNKRGDVWSAEKHGITAAHIKKRPAIARELANKRGVDMRVLGDSLIMSSVLGAYANAKMEVDRDPNAPDKSRDLYADLGEIGFLALGPLMYYFAKHIHSVATQKGIDQVVFLARDCWLPYQIMQAHQKRGGAREPRGIYLPVSRRSCQGLGYHTPEDVMRVHVAGFDPGRTVRDLFETRFEFTDEHMSRLAQDEADSLSRPISAFESVELYELAVRCATANHASLLEKSDRQRQDFKAYAQSEGVDFSRPALIVDFGYRGTIFNQIRDQFDVDPRLQMFLSFGDIFGEVGENFEEAFYLENGVGSYRMADPLVSDRLFLESIINKASPTAVGYGVSETGPRACLFGTAPPDAHMRAVEELHAGALAFAECWMEGYEEVETLAVPHFSVLNLFMRNLIAKPGPHVASLLAAVEYENEIDGHSSRSICGTKARNFEDKRMEGGGKRHAGDGAAATEGEPMGGMDPSASQAALWSAQKPRGGNMMPDHGATHGFRTGGLT